MDASRIRKKKFAFSQISGYVWTGPESRVFARDSVVEREEL